MQPGEPDRVVSYIHEHERQEAGNEADEDGQHQGCQTGVFFSLFQGDAVCFAPIFQLPLRLPDLPVNARVGHDDNETG